MKKKLKGGIEGIVALIILVGIVIALIIATVLPAAKEASAIGAEGEDRLSDLRGTISDDD